MDDSGGRERRAVGRDPLAGLPLAHARASVPPSERAATETGDYRRPGAGLPQEQPAASAPGGRVAPGRVPEFEDNLFVGPLAGTGDYRVPAAEYDDEGAEPPGPAHVGRRRGPPRSSFTLLKTLLGVAAVLLGVALILSVSGDFWNRRNAVATAVVMLVTPSPTPSRTPVPTPTTTLTPLVVENTPTAGNPATAVAAILEATMRAEQTGTRAPRPPNLATATPIVAVTATPTPGNTATAEMLAARATLVALTTGTATPLPPNVVTASPSPTTFIITSVPTPRNAETVMARVAEATALAERGVIPTPLPTNWVTPFVVTSTPTPANQATADRLVLEAYRAAMTTGTPTATPVNMFTATPSPTYFIITSVPTPRNAETALARLEEATGRAQREGTPTPLPDNWVTPIVVTATPTPANQATADRLTVVAYLISLTGTPTPTPRHMFTATPSPTYFIITSVPTPGNALTAEARQQAAEGEARLHGTPTSLPPNWVTPFVVTITPTPANQLTADNLTVVAYMAALTGTPTPTPPNLQTATPTPLLMVNAIISPTPTYTPTMTPTPNPFLVPAEFFDKIAFLSDREGGQAAYYIMDADGSNVQRLSGPDSYNAAAVRDTLDPTGQYQVFVSIPRHMDVDRDVGKNYEISLRRLADGYEWYIIGGTKGADYDPAYCQADPRYIAYVSQQSGGDDIFVVDLLSGTRDGAPLRTTRLTENDWPWDKHPSWTADCKQIVFSSNRDGRDQLWVMDFVGMDYPGGNPRKLSDDPYNNWDPVWIKPPPVAQ